MPTLSQEASRLTRWLHRLLPGDGEVAGLLALMLLTDARRQARTRPDGSLVPLAEQDRQKGDQAQIAEGIALISATLPRGEVGPYQLQAAIAAVHDEAKTMADTDWPQILGQGIKRGRHVRRMLVPFGDFDGAEDDIPAPPGVAELAPQPTRRHDGVGVGGGQPDRVRGAASRQPEQFGHARRPGRADVPGPNADHAGSAPPDPEPLMTPDP